MDPIDQIIVILGPPARDHSRYNWPGVPTGSAEHDVDELIQSLPGILSQVSVRADNQPSALDGIFSEVMEKPLRVEHATATFWEKEDSRYPAIHFSPENIVDERGNRVQQLIDSVLRESDKRVALAENLGRHLEIDWARLFVTFG